MLSTPEFKAFSERVVLFLHNTSYVMDEPYPKLLTEKGGNGYPTVAFLDHTGRLLTQQPDPIRKTTEFAVSLERLNRWSKLRAEVAEEAAGKRGKLFLMEVDLRMVGYAEAHRRLATLAKQLSKSETAKVERALVDMEFQSVFRTTDRRDQKSMIAAGEKFAAMIDKNRIPRSRQIITFWQAALLFAESRKDADQFAKIFERAKKEMGDDPRAKRYMQSVEGRLKRLRAKR